MEGTGAKVIGREDPADLPRSRAREGGDYRSSAETEGHKTASYLPFLKNNLLMGDLSFIPFCIS